MTLLLFMTSIFLMIHISQHSGSRISQRSIAGSAWSIWERAAWKYGFLSTRYLLMSTVLGISSHKDDRMIPGFVLNVSSMCVTV